MTSTWQMISNLGTQVNIPAKAFHGFSVNGITSGGHDFYPYAWPLWISRKTTKCSSIIYVPCALPLTNVTSYARLIIQRLRAALPNGLKLQKSILLLERELRTAANCSLSAVMMTFASSASDTKDFPLLSHWWRCPSRTPTDRTDPVTGVAAATLRLAFCISAESPRADREQCDWMGRSLLLNISTASRIKQAINY